jgi:uncharacterized protein with ParB-like and HNH nuclease domain
MKATEANLLEFLQSPQQFVIPIYQRTYSWTLAQCQQLWNDIRNAATNPAITAHFVGSIVYIKRSQYQVSEKIPQLLVIDGQQRLTTIRHGSFLSGRAAVRQGGRAIKAGGRAGAR